LFGPRTADSSDWHPPSDRRNIMEWKQTILRSRVARRILTLFIVCALAPVCVLAFLSYRQVSQQLDEQGRAGLDRASRLAGMGILERIMLLDEELKVVARELQTKKEGVAPRRHSQPHEEAGERFEALEVVNQIGGRRQIEGQVDMPPKLNPEEEAHIRSGATLLKTGDCAGPLCIWLIRQVRGPGPGEQWLIGKVNPEYLWKASEAAPPIQFEVLNEKGQQLYSSGEALPGYTAEIRDRMKQSPSGELKLGSGDETELAAYWAVFLKPKYFEPSWTVVARAPRRDLYASLTSFKKTFPLVMLLAVWIVLILSLIQIRRNLVPLEKLREGTRRIAERDFECRVQVKSQDEIQDLAASFNAMAEQLGKQFKALSKINEIDRAILSSWDTGKIVEALMTGLNALLPFDAVCLTMLDGHDASQAHSIVTFNQPKGTRESFSCSIRPEDLQHLATISEVRTHRRLQPIPEYLAPLRDLGMQSFVEAPILLKGKPSGFLCLGYLDEVRLSADDVSQFRQLADQMAVALTNARLVDDLEQLSNGALMAFARAIDAKSPWTAGHSERVTHWAVQIGRAMGLSESELKILFRGGLLHDIGKIGIPGMLLDKAGRLTPEEFRAMSEHVELGAKILEPIQGFAELIPIVLYHHERYDGSGYPKGLVGNEIPLNARIFAVADVYDALISDRPYRAGLSKEQVLLYLREKAGTQFDPSVVQAMIEVLSEEERRLEAERELAPSAI
jgi:putative nucleotidyltransferase with HDIG domain